MSNDNLSIGLSAWERSDIEKSFNSDNDLEKGKALPVGTINKYGEKKMGDGTWKYVGKQGDGGKAIAKDSDKKQKDPSKSEPKVGDTVSIKGDMPYLTKTEGLKGQNLKVVGMKDTGLTTQPKSLVVEDEKGGRHELNPTWVSDKGSPESKGSEEPKKGDTVKIPRALTTDPAGKQGQAGKVTDVNEHGDVTVKFPDGKEGTYTDGVVERVSNSSKTDEKTEPKVVGNKVYLEDSNSNLDHRTQRDAYEKLLQTGQKVYVNGEEDNNFYRAIDYSKALSKVKEAKKKSTVIDANDYDDRQTATDNLKKSIEDSFNSLFQDNTDDPKESIEH